MWLYVTESRRRPSTLTDVLAPLLNRPAEALRGLPIGSASHCAGRFGEYAAAGAERIFVWPLGDELHQLERFRETVLPLVPAH